MFVTGGALAWIIHASLTLSLDRQDVPAATPSQSVLVGAGLSLILLGRWGLRLTQKVGLG